MRLTLFIGASLIGATLIGEFQNDRLLNMVALQLIAKHTRRIGDVSWRVWEDYESILSLYTVDSTAWSSLALLSGQIVQQNLQARLSRKAFIRM